MNVLFGNSNSWAVRSRKDLPIPWAPVTRRAPSCGAAARSMMRAKSRGRLDRRSVGADHCPHCAAGSLRCFQPCVADVARSERSSMGSPRICHLDRGRGLAGVAPIRVAKCPHVNGVRGSAPTPSKQLCGKPQQVARRAPHARTIRFDGDRAVTLTAAQPHPAADASAHQDFQGRAQGVESATLNHIPRRRRGAAACELSSDRCAPRPHASTDLGVACHRISVAPCLAGIPSVAVGLRRTRHRPRVWPHRVGPHYTHVDY